MAKTIPYTKLFNLIAKGKLNKFKTLFEQYSSNVDINIQDEVRTTYVTWFLMVYNNAFLSWNAVL